MKDVASLGRPFRLTATVSNLNSPGIIGIIVASSTSGSIKIEDKPNGTTTTELNTMILPVGFTPLNMRCTGDTTITVAGTLDATLILTE